MKKKNSLPTRLRRLSCKPIALTNLRMLLVVNNRNSVLSTWYANKYFFLVCINILQIVRKCSNDSFSSSHSILVRLDTAPALNKRILTLQFSNKKPVSELSDAQLRSPFIGSSLTIVLDWEQQLKHPFLLHWKFSF